MKSVLSMFTSVNVVTGLIAIVFLIPVLAGIIRPFTSERIQRSFVSLFDSLIWLVSALLSIYLTRILLSSADNVILTELYRVFPALKPAVAHKDIWAYILFVALLMLLTGGILNLLAIPLYRHAVVPVSNRISSAFRSMNGYIRRAVGGLWELPRALWLVLLFSLLLNFYTEAFPASWVTGYASSSAPYRLVQDNVIQPLLNSSAVKNIQVLLNDSFQRAKADISQGRPLVRYFNGMTLDEAVRSNEDIDAEAKKIVGRETDARRKANLLYKWICKNIKYDYGKAEAITKDPSKVSSGAAVAYRTRTGVCFDYACLYVAMCRAAGVKVRFVTGLGYTGTAWGDHAWNQVYDPVKDAWINVDTTFGSSGVNYFDRSGFDRDHTDDTVQGEW